MSSTQQRVGLLLGSNVHPEVNLPKALKLLAGQFPVDRVSRVWETPAVGSDGPNFLNAAVLLYTPVDPQILKEKLLRPIEVQLGRVRSVDKNAPRTIDIDVVVWGDRTVDEDVWKYAHAAVPLAELIPDLRRQTFPEPLIRVAGKLSAEADIRARPDVSHQRFQTFHQSC